MELVETLREFMSSSGGSMEMTEGIWPESLPKWELNPPTLQPSMAISKTLTGDLFPIDANSSHYAR